MNHESDVLIPDLILDAPPRRSVIDGVGGGRAMRAILPVLAERHRTNPATELRLFEPRATKGHEIVRHAESQGVSLTLRPVRGEDGLRDSRDAGLILVHTDDPRTTAELLANEALIGRPILGQLLIKFGERIAGLRVAAERGDLTTRRAGTLLMERLAELRGRRGASAIVDDPRFAAIEEPVRAWMRAAVEREAERLEADIVPECDPLELTYDGIETLPVFVVETMAPEDPEELVRRTLERELEHRTLTRGTSFIVAEIPTHERALYLHEARLRLTDGDVRVLSREVLTSASFAPRSIARESGRPGSDGVGAVLALFAITAAAPVLVTD